MAKTSLLKFATTKNPSNNVCRLCSLAPPVLAEVDAGLARGVPATVIVEWLHTEYNMTLSDSSVRRHKRTHLK